LLLSFGFILYALITRNIVINDADRFAASFVQAYQCAPTMKDLANGDVAWDSISGKGDVNRAVKEIKKLGYSRAIVYQNRILKYGYLDGSRIVILKPCAKAAP
jgi:hypothetical protein